MSSSHGRAGGTGSVNIGSLLLLLGGAFAVIAAFLASQGFTGRDHVVGIDLGTTYSVVAISQKNNVTVIPDRYGHLITPSIVAFLPHGEILVGRQARAHRTKDPKHTIFNAKRFIGRRYDDVQQSSDTWPYEFAIREQTNIDNGVCFQVNVPGHPSCATPISIGATIVKHLRSMAHHFVGHNQITKAVIAVPVDFNAHQRDATVQVFHAAGLHVSRILEEPTAAAIAYGLHQDSNVNFILVFDFGGGTLDVSLLFTRSGSISVVDTIGDNNLGGEDVDSLIASFLTNEIEKHIGMKLASAASTMVETNSEYIEDPDELPCTLAGIRRAAELVKRKLSFQTSASASCVIQTDGKNLAANGPVIVEITRAQFEAICAPLFERTLVPVHDILTANHMTTEEIDAVVLVGGSSRIPWVRDRLTEMFNGRAPLSNIDPDIAVAYGAARTLD